MKKRISLMLAFAMTFALAACGAKEEVPPVSDQGGTGVPSYETAEDLLACSWEEIEAAAKQEGQLTFAVWGDEAEWNEACRVFKETYGIQVNVLAGDKNTVMDKVLVELSGDASIDLMFLSGETVTALRGAGALTPGILDIMQNKDKLVPGLSERKEGVTNDDRVWVPTSTNPAGFLYNANELTEETVPQTLEELTAFIEANPGKFCMCIPENGGTGQAVMESIIANLTGGLDQYLLAEGDVCDEELLAKWDAVWDWFNAHKDMITMTTSNGDGITRLNSGEVWLTTAWNSSVYNNVKSGNLSISHGFYVPDMGLCYSGEVLSVVKNATHPAAALLFINWLTSDAGQAAQAEHVAQMTGRIDIDQDISLLSADQRAKNQDWMASCYKKQYIKDFTTNVLQ